MKILAGIFIIMVIAACSIVGIIVACNIACQNCPYKKYCDQSIKNGQGPICKNNSINPHIPAQ